MKDVNNTEPKKMTDHLPIKTITAQQIREKVFSEGGLPDATEFYKASEIEQLLQRLGQPHVLTKVIKSITFGGKLTLEDLLT